MMSISAWCAGKRSGKNLIKAFEVLENEVYKRLGQQETLAAVPLDSAAVLPPKRCMKPCALSIWPPSVIREELNARGCNPPPKGVGGTTELRAPARLS